MAKSSKEPTTAELIVLAKERLAMADIVMTNQEVAKYVAGDDSLGVWAKDKVADLPVGYKRCGGCGEAKKFYLFNKNKATKNGCTGNCKVCQKKSAGKSYKKTKKKRNYAKYYQENKEMKREHARKYYEENKEKVLAKQQEYHTSKKGKQVMQKAHAKRRSAMKENAGIPYTRAIIIDRDSNFMQREKPVCWICGKPIEDTSGKGLHLDHVVSINNGGKDCFTNVACTHQECNLRKEKDDRNLQFEQVEKIRKVSEQYMDAYPEKFEAKEV